MSRPEKCPPAVWDLLVEAAEVAVDAGVEHPNPYSSTSLLFLTWAEEAWWETQR